MREIWETLKAEEFIRCRDAIEQENRLAIRLLASAGIPLSLANILAQTIFSYRLYLPQRSVWLLAYFIALSVLERYFIPRRSKHNTLMIYLLEVPPMVVAILLGTIWDPTHQAITFLMLIMCMPVFILDRPVRLFGITTAWTLVFVFFILHFKIPEVHRGDLFHTLEFYLASVAVTFVVLRVRLLSLQSRERAQYHLEHDDLTDMRNRRSLESRVELYVDKPLLVLLADMDQLTLYNDFYGHEIGDEMLVAFAQTIQDVFGPEHCYRFGGDEILSVVIGGEEEACLAKMEECRSRLGEQHFSGNKVNITCSFGYVMGVPATNKEFREMCQLADIYVHQAGQTGQDRTIGGTYDEEHLREGIVESNRATHARPYEINQLTGLPSMSFFLARTDELLSSVADVSRQPVIGFVNLIRFRDFNDAFGYAQGDELISYTGKLLQKAFPGRHVCYITGSQFGLLCYADEVEPGLNQVCDALQSFRVGFPIHAKAGFAVYTGSEQAVSLMDKAKVAHDSIYHKKGALFRIYDSGLDEEKRFQQYLVNHVDEAAEKGWLKVYYQPIARTFSGKVCNEEALSRWDDPVYGFLPPYRFIPTLEENRVIYKVNLHVVRQVLRDMDHRTELGVPVVPVSVNLSRYDFEQCDMVEEIARLVDESGHERNLLRIEVTESAFVENQELLRREVARFRERGFEVWMDDFGSEYSTLNLLQELDFDLIKIDMKFMKNFSESSKNGIIVADIIDMAKKMGITTLVEGVETLEQWRVLKKLGCEKLQGYLFNTPNPQEYIIQRALTGTGLTFESRYEAPYYREIGMIDLDSPFTSVDQKTGPNLSRELADGVLEYRSKTLACIRGTERFARLLSEMGLCAVGENASGRPYTIQINDALRRALERSRDAERWVNVILAREGKQGYTLYLRKVAVNRLNASVALLAVLLPVETN